MLAVIAHFVIASLTAFHMWLGGNLPAAPQVVADAGEVAIAHRGTLQAEARVRSTERSLTEARSAKAKLARIYEAQLQEIDRLKQRKASWRRDRMLRAQMAQSLETSKELTALDKQVRALEARLTRQRKTLLTAIDDELAAGPAGDRVRTLRTTRRQLVVELRGGSKKIVIPDVRIDQLADPEELDYQVAAIRQTEADLADEIAELEARGERYDRMAQLQDKRSRADELDRTDDDRPRRSTGRVGNSRDQGPAAGGGAADPLGETDATPPESPGDDFTGGGSPGFESDPTVVLADVVDAGTIDALRRAERSSDPKVKARAARRALEQVKAEQKRLERARKQIEKRARELRE
jgi:hypothetical protein